MGRCAADKGLRVQKKEAVQRKRFYGSQSLIEQCQEGIMLVLPRVPLIQTLTMKCQQVNRATKTLDMKPGNLRRTIEAKARTDIMQRCQRAWDIEKTGRWIYNLIPELSAWVSRSHGKMSFYFMQALTGHGCFKAYLLKFRKAQDERCK